MQKPIATRFDIEADEPVRRTCADPGRRRFNTLLATGALVAAFPALAQDGGLRGDVGRTSRFSKLVPAEQVEAAAAQQYQQLLREASSKNALAGASNPQLQRLRYIAERMIPFTTAWNSRASQWKWEVNLLMSPTLNAFCMPGGKIAFYYGILQKLQLSDDEVALIMGHETAHALREHAREQMGKSGALNLGAGLVSSIFGLGNLGNAALNAGGQLLTLRFGREDETEADIVGLDLAARAGYDPAAGVTLWQKMLAASQGAPPEFLSTHPAGQTRIREIQSKLPKVEPLYRKAPKPDRRFDPPPA
ncbi:MAG: M48 family metallopeptidase [Pseudomonadota bacterium]|nr:M48 family metallopeptidase [Pseudomonadota bacterium]